MITPLQIIEKRKQLWKETKNIEQDREYIKSAAQYIIEHKEILETIQNHPETLIEMFFVVVDKNKNTVPFFLNDVQMDFINNLNKAIDDYKQGKQLSINILILKGRQQGFTSLITAYQLACTITRKNFTGFTIADCNDNTNSIFEDKGKFPYSKLPEELKPTEKYNNRKEMLFEKINSSWRIATASKNLGRSKTINFLHISEAAFLDVLLSDLQASVGEALTKSAIKILESTANGYNEFKDAWDSGKYINLFYEWWRTAEYRVTFESESKEKQFKHDVQTKTDWVYQRCKWLKERLDWKQVYWYFEKWDGYINKGLIKQEYPCTVDEAFLASGNCVFDKEKIIQRKEFLIRYYKKETYKQGEFIITWNNPDKKDYPVSFKWSENPNGLIKIYEDRQPEYPYVIGGDTKGEGSDRFGLSCINNHTGIRAATLHSEMTSKDYTSQAWAMAMYYNEALIGIETNFNTYPIELLQDWGYSRQYMREKKDTITGELKKQHGFKTDGNTRPLIIEKEITAVNESMESFTDIEMLNEMLSFVTNDKGRPDAESGKHDDLLFADMIANEIRGQQTYMVDTKKQQKDYDDEDDDRHDDDSFYN